MTPEQIEFYQKLANFIQYQNGENLEELFRAYLQTKPKEERVSILLDLDFCEYCGAETKDDFRCEYCREWTE
jgi:hypothetical protein